MKLFSKEVKDMNELNEVLKSNRKTNDYTSFACNGALGRISIGDFVAIKQI